MQQPHAINKDELKALLETHFPETIQDGELNIDLLKQAFEGEYNENDNEAYGLQWRGKAQAKRIAMSHSKGTLIPKATYPKTPPSGAGGLPFNQHLLIEGDNLEVLKILQRSYAGKVKMIYIDPPYNTGNDFVYKDSFADPLRAYLKEGSNLLVSNNAANSRFHADWLSMMYPRLRAAKSLLREDGVIFVSIDDNEVHNLRILMNEVFGESNFIEMFSWVKTSTAPALSYKSRKTIEYIICFEKNRNTNKYKGELLDGGDQPLLNSGNKRRVLHFPKDKVFFKLDREYKAGVYERVRLVDDIIVSNGYANIDFSLEGEFKWTQENLNKEIENGTTFIMKSEKLSIRFIKNEDEEGYKAPTNLIKDKYVSPVINKENSRVGTNEEASSEIENLFGARLFDFPKPVSLLKHIVNFCVEPNDLILDFFAGSGTTAHAVMELNAEDGGNKRSISIQMPEALDEKSEAYKAGYRTIFDITQTRLQKVCDKLKAEKGYETGFLTFSLSASSLAEWIPPQNELKPVRDLFAQRAESSLAPEWKVENVINELRLLKGFPLHLPAQRVGEFTENEVWEIYDSEKEAGLLICLDSQITEKTCEQILLHRAGKARDAYKFIARDEAFAGKDELKITFADRAHIETI